MESSTICNDITCPFMLIAAITVIGFKETFLSLILIGLFCYVNQTFGKNCKNGLSQEKNLLLLRSVNHLQEGCKSTQSAGNVILELWTGHEY